MAAVNSRKYRSKKTRVFVEKTRMFVETRFFGSDKQRVLRKRVKAGAFLVPFKVLTST